MSAVGQEFWLIGCACEGRSAENHFDRLQSDRSIGAKGGSVFKFDVPVGDQALQFGSFDNLIRLTDELQKHDSQIEGMVHRLERQSLELDPNVQFKVVSQRQEMNFMDYFKSWTWDDAKYPKSRTISENMALLMKSIAQFDDECRKKTTEYNDLKTQHGNVSQKDQTALLPARDIIDLCTPDTVTQGSSVAANDFVYSEYLDTVVVILPKGADVEFLTGYETFAENVVPMSAKRFAAFDDKDGNMLWRAVCFKSSTEAFKKACRDKRWLVRDFVYDADAYQKLTVQREQLGKQTKQHLELVKGLYQAAWSDSVVAWMHVKAARLFVESVLRFGMPPSFASFAVSPPANKVGPARKALADLFPARADAMASKQAGGRAEDDDEEFYPYVSLSLTPFVVPR